VSLFIRVVAGTGNNVRMTLLTAPFAMSTQSQERYSHFTHLNTLCWAYQTMTRVSYTGHSTDGP
jgi:hypothetical protein